MVFLLSSIAYAHPGVGIVEDSRGNVYYTDLSQVWKISTDGSKSIAVPRVHTHELFIDESDNLYGEHLWYNGDQKNTWGHYAWRLAPNGKFEKVIPETEGFLENYSFVRDHFGRMYWADRSKPCQTVARKEGSTITRVGNHCFENIQFMIESDGSLFVVDFQDLKKVDGNGGLTTIASKIANKDWTSSTNNNQNSVMGIWTDTRGNLYAAVSSERKVKKFGTDGKEEVVHQTSFPWSPSGGMVDAKGNLWVLECSFTNAVRVEKIDVNKKKTTY